MKKIILMMIRLAAGSLCLCCAGFAQASIDCFVQIIDNTNNPIKGDSTFPQALNWIEISNYTFDTQQQETPSFVFTKRMDNASVELAFLASSGGPVKSITLDEYKSNSRNAGVLFYKLVLSNCVISDFNDSFGGGESQPSERVKVDFQSMQWSYANFGANGEVANWTTKSWNIDQ